MSFERFPPVDPFDDGMLDVGDGHSIYWCVSGSPDGKPVVILHGGPGSGLGAGTRRLHDPARYRIVQFDQRNCGRSTPSAAEPEIDLSTNTTANLVGDIEALRAHLAVERWQVWGASWGTELGLAYAEAHPERVTELVLVSVVSSATRNIQWITRDMGRVFPAEWERFRDAVPPAERDGDLAAAYSRLLHDRDPAVRERAAKAWCDWEDTHVATVPGYEPNPRYDDPAFRLAFSRLVTHYWSNRAFLPDGEILRRAHRLAGIPGVMIHGRLDISGPVDVAWELARAWADAELTIVHDAGHGGMTDRVVEATNRFASLSS
jgi:proline iminopeptidase